MKRTSSMKNVEEGRNVPVRFASFFMAAQPLLHVCGANASFERVTIMRNDKLSVQSMDFAVAIIALVKDLKNQRETIISNQIGRSGTSIGANIREAQYAHGKADFMAKLQIALKEANETGYWLELLHRTGYLPLESYRNLDAQCTSLRAMLVASINTAKKNQSL